MHLVKLNNGIYIDEKRVNGVTDVAINSNVNNFSEVTIKLICKVDGLDNIKTPPYRFKEQIAEKTYKPNRKYQSRY